jgi:putative oxidoreductase
MAATLEAGYDGHRDREGTTMTFSNTLARAAHWPLRIALSSVFLYHGLAKFSNLGGLSDTMGMPVALIAVLAGVEVVGALLILAGGFGSDLMTRLGGLLLASVMLGAIFMVHLQYGWNSVNTGSGNMGRGMEFQFTLFMIALYFVLKGNRTFVRIEREKVPYRHAQSATHDRRPQPKPREEVRHLEPEPSDI